MNEDNTPKLKSVAKFPPRTVYAVINKGTYKKHNPRETDYYIRCKKIEGFYIRVLPSGYKSYGVRKRLFGVGKAPSKTIGNCEVVDIEEAKKLAKKYLSNLGQGVTPDALEKEKAQKGRTLIDYLDIYIRRMGNEIKESTAESYRKNLTSHMPKLIKKPIVELTKDDFTDWYGTNVKVKPRVTELTFVYAKRLLNYAVADEYLEDNVANKAKDLIGRYQGSNEVERHIPLSKLSDFMSAFISLSPYNTEDDFQPDRKDLTKLGKGKRRKTLLSHTQRDFILFILLTGVRRSEATNLRWANVDFQDYAVTIPDNKAKRFFRFPMTYTLRAMLEWRYNRKDRHHEFVFPREINTRWKSRERFIGGGLTDIRKPLAKICELGNFDYVLTAHDLRRTFATICNELGIAVTDIAKLLNHAKREVTDNYIVRSLENQRDSYNKVIEEIENSLRITWKLGEEEEHSTFGVKNAFRYMFYEQPQQLVYMNESLPQPTFWDDYMTTPVDEIEKESQEQYHREGKEELERKRQEASKDNKP